MHIRRPYPLAQKRSIFRQLKKIVSWHIQWLTAFSFFSESILEVLAYFFSPKFLKEMY